MYGKSSEFVAISRGYRPSVPSTQFGRWLPTNAGVIAFLTRPHGAKDIELRVRAELSHVLPNSIETEACKQFRAAAGSGNVAKMLDYYCFIQNNFPECDPIVSQSTNGNTALHWAIARQQLDAVDTLLNGLDASYSIVNRDNKTPIDCIITQGLNGQHGMSRHVGSLFIIKKYEETEGFTSKGFRHAVYCGDLEAVKFYVEVAGIHVNEKGSTTGITALHVAVKGLLKSEDNYATQEQMIRYLLSQGADSFIEDNHGRSPVHYATDEGVMHYTDIIGMLLEPPLHDALRSRSV